MNNPLPIEGVRKKSLETPICFAIAHINAQIERASAHQKWSIEIDYTHEANKANKIHYNELAGKRNLRGESAARLLPDDVRQALAIFRREGYGVSYFYDQVDVEDEPGAWAYCVKVEINWN